jgi:hypothetical protein
LEERDVERPVGHHRAAEQAHDIGVEGEQRQHQDQRQHPRQHQDLHGVEADGAHGIDLLVDLHGADLGREGRAGAPGHDDRRQHDRHLAQDADPDQVHGEDLGSELLELIGALIGQHHADQERDQADDRHGVEARPLHLVDQRRPADPAGAKQRADEDDYRMPEEIGQAEGLVEHEVGRAAGPLHEGRQRTPGRRRRRAVEVVAAHRFDQTAVGLEAAAQFDLQAAGGELLGRAMHQQGARGVEGLEAREVDARRPRAVRYQAVERDVLSRDRHRGPGPGQFEHEAVGVLAPGEARPGPGARSDRTAGGATRPAVAGVMTDFRRLKRVRHGCTLRRCSKCNGSKGAEKLAVQRPSLGRPSPLAPSPQ